MKRNKTAAMLLSAMFILTMIPMLGVDIGSAASTAKVYIEPTPVYKFGPYWDPYKWNNTWFVVEVRVANVTDLYGFEVYIGYNTSNLRFNGAWEKGTNQTVHGTGGVDYLFSVKKPPDTSADTVAAVCGWFTRPSFNASGPDWGVLCWFNFTIIHAPKQIIGSPKTNNVTGCDLDLCPHPGVGECTKIGNSIPQSIPHTQVNGHFTYEVEGLAPGVPTADFHWTPSVVYVCTDVQLWDDSDPGNLAHITAWLWTLTGNGTWLTSNTIQNPKFHCNGTGFATVNLQVWNNWTNTHNVTKDIEQKPMIGPFFDLYTSTNRFCGQTTTVIGEGPNEPCDALSPDVNVTLFAEVKWGGAPVNHALVAFEIIWEWYIDWQDPASQLKPVLKNITVVYRTAETNKEGIATIWFRVPTPCEGMMFGKWLAIAKCKVQEEPLEDSMRFHVGYYITLVEVYTTEKSYIRDCSDITVIIKGKNIGYMDKWVTLVVTIYDDCDVPIGVNMYVDLEINGGWYCNPIHFQLIWTDALHVPQWAYVGLGKIYASLFTAPPRYCGIPYCPEKSNAFEIVYVP